MIPYFFAWGPFCLNTYGLAIAIGLIAFVYTFLQNPRARGIITATQLTNIVAFATLIGIAGGRILYIVLHAHQFHNPLEWLFIWEGGLSVLGAVIAILLCMPWYIYQQKLPLWPLLDIAAVHAPLLHAIARLGCFGAGCCTGMVTSVAWAIVYSHPDSMAPLGLPLHPTQLYSSLVLIGLYVLLRYGLQPILTRPGQLAGCYLIGAGLERGINEFFRFEFEPHIWGLSTQHFIAASLVIVGIALITYASKKELA